MAVPLRLKVYKGDVLVATRDYERDMIKIGRLATAHLCLDDEKASRIHSVLNVEGDGKLSIVDMGSVEGTFLNGRRVNKGTVQFGDEIRVGGTRIVVEQGVAGAAQASASPAQASSIAAGPQPSPPRRPQPLPFPRRPLWPPFHRRRRVSRRPPRSFRPRPRLLLRLRCRPRPSWRRRLPRPLRHRVQGTSLRLGPGRRGASRLGRRTSHPRRSRAAAIANSTSSTAPSIPTYRSSPWPAARQTRRKGSSACRFATTGATSFCR
jgi:pSer/pThr/pTyr-binding forkhead associated (FHA) protein